MNIVALAILWHITLTLLSRISRCRKWRDLSSLMNWSAGLAVLQ